MTKGQIAGTVIGVLAAVALGICICTYFQKLKGDPGSAAEELYDGAEGDGQPDEEDDEEYAREHPEAKKSAALNPMHAVERFMMSTILAV